MLVAFLPGRPRIAGGRLHGVACWRVSLLLLALGLLVAAPVFGWWLSGQL